MLRYVLQEMVGLCDNVLAETAGINSDPENFLTYLKVCMALFVMSQMPSALVSDH